MPCVCPRTFCCRTSRLLGSGEWPRTMAALPFPLGPRASLATGLFLLLLLQISNRVMAKTGGHSKDKIQSAEGKACPVRAGDGGKGRRGSMASTYSPCL